MMTRRIEITSVLRDILHRGPDRRCSIERDIDFDSWRYGGLQCGQHAKDVIHRLDYVRARALEDHDENRGLAVEQTSRVDILDSVEDARDILNAHDTVRGRRATRFRC